MKQSKLVMGVRILLGLMLVVFGLNGFIQFMSMGPMPEGAMALMTALSTSGILMIVKSLEIIIGLALLFNKYTPLATIMLFPLSVNFVLFHALLAPASIAVALVTFIFNVYLIYAYADKYKPMLHA